MAKTKTGTRRWIVLIALVFASASARAAVVYLKDGGTLEGTIQSSKAQGVELRMGDRTVLIPADRIGRIDYAQNQAAPEAPAAPPAPSEGPRYYPPPRRRWRRAWVRREAPFEEQRHELSFDVGATVPLNDVDFSAVGGGRASNGDSGVLTGLRYLYYTDPRWAFGFDFQYLDRSWNGSQNLYPDAQTDVAGDSEAFLGMFKYRFATTGPMRPYLTAGGGWHRTTLMINARPDFFSAGWPNTGTYEGRTLVDDSAWGPAASARLGLEFPSWDPSFFAMELGWTGLFGAKFGPTLAGSQLGMGTFTGPLNILTIGGRVGWKF